ncbi:unnamed protein product [Acanthoscelides obtectus]|uniref:PiggyBac transposable element-derived protein domain-containing protein n=1 Tax=Acanthoscelides obtectus TaxID=200917 RepID=A0A9P0VTA8_ACAOB|nr:unnamed protein product [Acanthoscelides obtectus]CAK1689426.1 hypothetical protein AOBTE_LOCUS37252 [Acanthoscelides obtectus]
MIESIQANFSRDRDANFTNSDELYALLGFVYLAGKYKASHLNLDDLWKADGSGIEIFRYLKVETSEQGFSYCQVKSKRSSDKYCLEKLYSGCLQNIG